MNSQGLVDELLPEGALKRLGRCAIGQLKQFSLGDVGHLAALDRHRRWRCIEIAHGRVGLALPRYPFREKIDQKSDPGDQQEGDPVAGFIPLDGVMDEKDLGHDFKDGQKMHGSTPVDVTGMAPYRGLEP
ncbi:hypothetical protein [Desulfosarcina cetonica]|uniref:hypothetical protein n=1 Tax=Desulfosarcina cetonica TaxID=90730 RepID=UPI0012EEAD71|nr:hypothetical protein [Desulfosarcina cetonica]